MGVKLKIFIGYVVLILLLGFIIFLFRGERIKRGALNHEMKELGIMRDLTRKAYSSLLELASQGEVASIWSASDLQLYREKREKTCEILWKLRDFVPVPEQKARIDSVCLLLREKEILLSAAMSTFDELETISETVGEKLPAIVRQVRRQPVRNLPAIPVREETATEEPEKEKKNFWKSLFGKREKKSAYRERQEEKKGRETARKAPAPPISNSGNNTAVYLLNSLNREVTEKRKTQRTRLFLQMDSLHHSSQILNQRLNGLVGDFEKAGNERLEAGYSKIVADSEESYNVAASLAVCIFLLAIVLYLIVHRDTGRRIKCLRELECLNGKNRELLTARDNMMLAVSHDLRAPLTVIRGYADAMPDERAREMRSRYRDAILQSSDSMLALLNNLLTFYRLDMRKEQPDNCLFRLKGIADTLETAYRLQAENKKLHFKVESGNGQDAVLLGDRERILQIGNNLLSNAIKFTSSGNVTLYIRYRNGLLHMEVGDTGVGIPRERLDGIFQPFERLNDADMQEGFGLGLAITREIVELLHGEISVESHVDYGTTFHVRIPLPLADEDTVGKQMGSPVSLPENLHVAVVDNDAVLLEMTVGMFTRQKIHCDGYHSAKELLEGMRERTYDIVITDIRMPGINGFELLELLRTSSIPALKTIPVLAVSARMEKLGDEFVKAGFSGYLRKPFSASELFSAVKSSIREVRERPFPKADFSALLVAERNQEEMLELFISETRKDMAMLEKYVQEGDTERLLTLVHHLSPVWEEIRISAPLRELRKLLSSPDTVSDDALDTAVKKVAGMGEQAAIQAERMIANDKKG